MSEKHKAESKLFEDLTKAHGYKFRALDLGMQTARDRYPMVRDPATGVIEPMVSFVVSVPRDSSMGAAFVEFYGKTEVMSTNTPGNDELLTDADVSRLYAIKPGTLRALRSRGQIPYVRLGGRIIRYRREELEAWVTSRAVGLR